MAKLFQAIERGDTGQVWKLIQEGARLDEVDPATEMTALAMAAESGSAEIVRMLLSAGADPDRGGLTSPLEAAVVEGHLEAARALVEAAADLNQRVAEGFTPLMTAAATGNAHLVRLLLTAGARPQLTNEAGETALSLAQGENHEMVIEELQRHRRRRAQEAAEARDAAGEEAAAEENAASGRDDDDAMESAAGAIAEDTAAFDDREAAGEEAAAEENAASGGDDDAFGAEKEPEADFVVDGEAPEIDDWDRHFAGGAKPAEPRPTEEPPAEPPVSQAIDSALAGELGRLIEEGAVDGLRRLLESGELGIDDRDEAGRTPLMLAASHGEPATVRWLLDAGAAPDLTDHTPSGCSALVYAVRSSSPQRPEVVSILVDAGADLNRPCGRNRRTPLMHAAETDVYVETEGPFGFARTTKTLISLGAELEIMDRRGYTVWHQTKRNALGARTSSAYRRRLHQMLRVLEYSGAEPIASHRV